MNPKGIDGVIQMSKHKPFAFRRTIQKKDYKRKYVVLYAQKSKPKTNLQR